VPFVVGMPSGIGLEFKEGATRLVHWEHSIGWGGMGGGVLFLGAVRKVEQEYCKVLKCGAGAEWRRSVGEIV
jgi:hypothetical protein